MLSSTVKIDMCYMHYTAKDFTRVSLIHIHFDEMNFFFLQERNFKVAGPCYILVAGRSIFTIENTTVSLA